MLFLLRLRLYKSLHMSGLQCYAHPADGGKAYGWALGSEFFGEDELECGARSWGGGVGERGVGGGWGASGLAWPSPGRGLRRPGSEVRPPPPRARSL